MLGYWLGCIPCWVIGWYVFHVGSLVELYSMLNHWLCCLPLLVIGYWFIPFLVIGIRG